MSNNLQKTIDRTKEKIDAGQFYEAHQAVRTIATRYIRARKYQDAIDLLYQSTLQLLEAKQPGSAADLTTYLVSTLEMAQQPVDSTTKGRISQILRLFDVYDPSLKQIAQEVIGWTMKFGPVPYGDPELHHIFGTIFAQADEAYDAEKHLILGTKDSAPILAKLLYEWFTEDPSSTTTANSVAGIYCARGVFGYLEVQNIGNCITFLDLFLDKFSKVVSPQEEVCDNDIKIKVYESVPLLNFLQLLVHCCRYKNKDMFLRLRNRYADLLKSIPALSAPMEKIAQLYFGLAASNQQNVLQGLLGSLFAPPRAS